MVEDLWYQGRMAAEDYLLYSLNIDITCNKSFYFLGLNIQIDNSFC